MNWKQNRRQSIHSHESQLVTWNSQTTELAALLRHQDLFPPPSCQSWFHLESSNPLFFAIKFHINTSQLPTLLALPFVYLYSMWSRANAPASLKSYSCTKYTWETRPSETGHPLMFNLTSAYCLNIFLSIRCKIPYCLRFFFNIL